VSQTIPNKGAIVPNTNYGLWLANTPSDTEAFGLTYQQKYFDIGIFDKRVGTMWNDNNDTKAGLVDSQVIPINSFNTTNVFFNYTIRKGSHFDQTKFRLSLNNILNARGIAGVTQVAKGPTYTPGNGDSLILLPGRSITMSVTLGFSPREK
jgi:iron complex outermembrane receptor protein